MKAIPTAGRIGHRRALKAAAITTAVVSALALTGCGSSSKTSSKTNNGNSPSSTGKVTGGSQKATGSAMSGSITWWASSITSSNPDPRVVLINAFEKAYPHIHVSLQNAPSSTTTNESTLETDIEGGSGPDVFMGDVVWPATFGAHGYAVPLSDYLPTSYFQGFAPGLAEGASYDGKVYGAPFFTDSGFLYYRKDLLAEDGLPVPKTWAQVVSDSKTILAKKQTQFGYVFQGADYEGAVCNFMEFLGDAANSNTNTVLNSSGTDTTLTSSPAALKALTFEDSLVQDGISPKAESTYEELNAMNAFEGGQAAFMRNWDYGYSTSQSAGSKVIGKVGVAPLPAFSAADYPGYANIGGWNLYINPHSKNKAADLTFIKWMTGTQAQTILASQFSEIPTLQSVRVAPNVKKLNPNDALLGELKLIPRPSNNPKYPAISQAMYQNISAMLAGQKTPAQALSGMNAGVKQAISNNGL